MALALLSSSGTSALRRLVQQRALLAFDLDGTLAPLVPNPAHAQVPQQTAGYLRTLLAHWPIAVITGRQHDDAQQKLGFTPTYLIGNHGAEEPRAAHNELWSAQLNECRKLLQPHLALFRKMGVWYEDKSLSLALHYRHARNPAEMVKWLRNLLRPLAGQIHIFAGHLVLNIAPLHAPDKGDALLKILRLCEARCALVVGDDLNDESAFAKAPEGSVCVRIGAPTKTSNAQFYLNYQSEIKVLLALLLGFKTSLQTSVALKQNRLQTEQQL